jgi:hypothetical protein
VLGKAALFATQKLLDPVTIATMTFTLDFHFSWVKSVSLIQEGYRSHADYTAREDDKNMPFITGPVFHGLLARPEIESCPLFWRDAQGIRQTSGMEGLRQCGKLHGQRVSAGFSG